MNKIRLEAFSDGVFAILITILVLELKVPHGGGWDALVPLMPVFVTYVLSFVYLGIYWNNHHHMLHMAHRVNGKILWANLHLLFWLSLLPFATGWAGENRFESAPNAVYGSVLFCAGVAFLILQTLIIADQGLESKLRVAVGSDWKGRLSAVLYATAIGFAFLNPRVSDLIYVGVALLWLIPDQRIERAVSVEN